MADETLMVNIETLWRRYEYPLFYERTSDPSQRDEAKRCFFHGVQAGIRIVMLLNKTFDIKDESERLDAEEKVWQQIESIGDQVAQFLLTTWPQQLPAETKSP